MFRYIVAVLLCAIIFAGCSNTVRVATQEHFRHHTQNDIYRDMQPYAMDAHEYSPISTPQEIQNIYSKKAIDRYQKPKNRKQRKRVRVTRKIRQTQKDIRQIRRVLNEHIKQEWGAKEIERDNRKRLVKYTNHYKSRSRIDFENGHIIVETIDSHKPQESLKKAIIATLLAPNNPDGIEIADDSAISFNGRPYLADFIKDHDGEQILYEWRANRYAEYLLHNKLQKRISNGNRVWFVHFAMEKDFSKTQSIQYHDIITKYTRINNVDRALVLGIIKTESSFNPYATSNAPAYGLMQIVPDSAGKDAYEVINGYSGMPTAYMLYKPEINIQYGTTYLNILATRYLNGITNAQSQEYCIIAAYNAGAGAVLQTFHEDKKRAIEIINKKTPNEIYNILVRNLPSYEGRRYLEKVTMAKRDFIHVNYRGK